MIIDYISTTEPRHGSREAAGYDIPIRIDYDPLMLDECYEMIAPNSIKIFRTGLFVQLPVGTFGDIRTRSSAIKKGLIIHASVVDSDYRSEIHVPVYNASDRWVKVYDGECLAQIVVQRHETVQWHKVDKLHETERGSGSFGSTDR